MATLEQFGTISAVTVNVARVAKVATLEQFGTVSAVTVNDYSLSRPK